MKKHKLNHGFTIIEVILVLVVARLFFLMVFLAHSPHFNDSKETHKEKTMLEICLLRLSNFNHTIKVKNLL